LDPRLQALKQAFSLDERTVFRLHGRSVETLAGHCPDEPEAFRDGLELRYRVILVISADSVDFDRDVRNYDECVDRINEKYGPATAIKFQTSGKWGLNG
jgi:hypothetical protein